MKSDYESASGRSFREGINGRFISPNKYAVIWIRENLEPFGHFIGVRSIRIKPGEVLISCLLMSEKGEEVFVVTEGGIGDELKLF